MIEAVIAISAGIAAESVSLGGFGLDSIVEVSAGLIILWQFRHALPESREQQAPKLKALAFFALAAYVTVESTRSLITGHTPDHSTVGIVLTAVSLVIMPALSIAQRRTGRLLSSASVVADGTQTRLCTYLSAVLLIGSSSTAPAAGPGADPIAGLIIAAVAVKEGREAWRGDNCCAPAVSLTDPDAACGCGAGRTLARTSRCRPT